jgi:diguanylate cyclase (GGDEF)-like protein
MASEKQLSAVLSEFARTMVTDFPIQAILDQLVQRIVEIMPISGAGVTLISATTSPRYVAASDAAALRYEELQTELGEGPCLTAYRTGTAVAVADLGDDDRFSVFGARAVAAGLGAVFTFPLHKGHTRLGALDLYRDTTGPLNDDDMVTAQTLADVTASYLINAQARSDLLDASNRSHESSVHDPLTGLPNRILLVQRIEHALLRSLRNGKLVAILFVDLDRFKAINDAHGHQVGDEVLVAVGRRISGLLRPADTLARLSGDEFVIVCEDLDGEHQAQIIARRVVNSLALPFTVTGIDVDLSASVGVAFAGSGHHDPQDLLQEADTAMYQVKRKGGANHQVVDLREKTVADHHATLRRDLDVAIQRRELRVDYQPIIATADGRLMGVEALLRWDHPVQGAIGPTTVIPLAEQSGAITEIGRWVLTQACLDRQRWVDAGDDTGGSVAVNVSAHQLMAPDFVSMVTGVLARTGTNPAQLTLEITEGVFVHDRRRALIVLTNLRKLGLHLALDDFGTGNSSLNYLKHFPIDIVKLDQSFIADLGRDAASHAIVTKIIELAHLLNLSVVSEGVETAEQNDEVRLLGSDFSQGFYIARPMAADVIGAFREMSEQCA